MSVAGRKLTIRLPDGRRLNGAEVVGIHSDPGGSVRDGMPIVTLRTVRGQHVVRAPRRGSAVPLVSVGDTVVAGDPLFILNVDEDALTVSKDLRRRTMMRSGVAAVAEARRYGSARDRGPHDRPVRLEPHPLAEPADDSEALLDWLKPGLAMAIYAMAAFLLLPVFSQLGGEASGTEIIIMAGLAVAVAALMAIFLSPSRGWWPRWTVRLIALSWLMLSSAVLFTRVMQPPDFVVAGSGPDETRRPGSDGRLSEMPFGDDDGAAIAEDAAAADEAGPAGTAVAIGPGHAGPLPPAARAAGVRAGQTDLIPMPRMTVPGRLDQARGVPAAMTAALPGNVPAVAAGFAGAALALPELADGLLEPAVSGDGQRVLRTGPGEAPAAAPFDGGQFPEPRVPDLPAAAGGDLTAAPDDAISPEPAALRAGEAGWMEAQADRAEGTLFEHGQGQAAGGAGEPARWMQTPAGDSEPAWLEGDAALTRIPDHDAPAALPVLEGRPAPSGADADPIRTVGPGAAPVLSAISPDLVAGRDPAAAPRVPQAVAAPATRMLLYLFYDDPRLDERPRVGDAWAAELPAELAGAVWSNTVVAEHGIVQVDSWCGEEGADATRAWLGDRIRLLQVRVEIDPDSIDAFETALPIFGDQPPGFFHNRRPLLGGTADAPLMARARSYLRDMPGGGFFDDAAKLTRAMQDAGCTRATWNGGDGPANAIGTELSSRFGS